MPDERASPLRTRATRAVYWAAVQNWGGELLSFAVFLLLARLLLPEAFGLVALATVYIGLLQLLVDQGFAEAVVQREALEPEHLDSAFWISTGTGVAFALATIPLAHPVARWMGEPKLAPILMALSAMLVLAGLRNVQEAKMRREFAFKALALRTTIAGLLGGVAGVALAFAGAGVWALVAQQLTTGVVSLIALWSASDWRPHLRFSMRHTRDLLGFSSNLLGARMLTATNRRMPDFLIGYFLGSVALGYFTVAYRIIRVFMRVLPNVIRQVAIPVFSRLQEHPERLRSAFLRATRLTGVVSIPLFAGLAALSPVLVPSWFGPQWRPAIPVMQVLAVFGAASSVATFNGAVMMALGKTHWQLRIELVNTLLTGLGFFIAAPYGITAVACVFLLQSFITAPFVTALVTRLLDIPRASYIRTFVSPGLSALVMFGAVTLLAAWSDEYLRPGFALPLLTITGVAVYAGLIGLIDRPLARELVGSARSIVR